MPPWKATNYAFVFFLAITVGFGYASYFFGCLWVIGGIFWLVVGGYGWLWMVLASCEWFWWVVSFVIYKVVAFTFVSTKLNAWFSLRLIVK